MGERIFIAIVSAALGGCIAYFVGRLGEKRKAKREAIVAMAGEIRADLRKLSDRARSYFLDDMPSSDRIRLQVEIQVFVLRISTDIHRLVEKCGMMATATTLLRLYRDAVSGEPFGDENFQPLPASDDRINQIQVAEGNLIRMIQRIEDAA